MSTIQQTLPTKGTVDDIDVESVDVHSIEDSQRAVDVVEFLEMEFEKYEREVHSLLRELQSAVDTTDITLPTDPMQVPLPDFGGRDWVSRHEGDVPFPVLAHLVVLVEHKAKAETARIKHRVLMVRLEEEFTDVQLDAAGPTATASRQRGPEPEPHVTSRGFQ